MWPTPVPLPTPDATPIALGIDGQYVSERFVVGWQTLKSAGAIDWLVTIIILAMVIFGILSIIQHARNI